MTDALDAKVAQLGWLVGIHRDYWDIWGQCHPIDPQTQRCFLQAMGYSIDNIPDVDSAIRQVQLSAWRKTLPPVIVCRVGEPLRVPLALPQCVAPADVQWTLTADDGHIDQGTAALATPVEPIPQELAGESFAHWQLELSIQSASGYFSFDVSWPSGPRVPTTNVIVAPSTCFVPVDGRRRWGIALQLYGLRSAKNWGIGDFDDLERVGKTLAALGADLVGINPLHALYLDDSGRASPYSPSSRRFLNPLFLHVDAIPDFVDSGEGRKMRADDDVRAELIALREAPHVDYQRVGALKRRAFDIAFRQFCANELSVNSRRAQAYQAFCELHGTALDDFALHQSLRDHGLTPPPVHSAQALRLAKKYAADVEFHRYLQWQCDLQLAGVASALTAAGMSIGLYRDLAVGCDADGADIWSDPTLYARGMEAGAPPDELAPQGQAWGLCPWVPEALRTRAFEPFVQCVRANMRHAGALRVDHVVGLLRQFWVPSALGALRGGYVGSPLRELLAVLALESERNECMVIGEDLGTIPPELRAALRDAQVLSYCVLYFEKRWESDRKFSLPSEYPKYALVTSGTHDLPTLAGYCLGRDLDIREQLSLYPSQDVGARQRAGRGTDVLDLSEALIQAGLMEAGEACELGCTPSDEFSQATQQYLSATPSLLMVVQLEDLVGEVEQANVPGTTEEQPNWRRKLSVPVESLSEHAQLRAISQRIRRERPA